MKLSKKIRRSAAYRITQFLILFFNRLPRSVAIYIGSWLALGAWMVLARERHKSRRHLNLVYRDSLSERDKEIICRDFFVNSGRNGVDAIRLRRHFTTQLRPIIEAEGMEYLRAAYRQGKGLIAITGHIGNFELLAAYIQSEGYSLAVIGRELYHGGLDRLLVSNREAVGVTNIYTTDSPRRAVSWLRQGKVLGVLIDTDSSRVRGMFIPAFGRWSNTPVGQSVLGLKTGAAFVPLACLRTGHNRYKVIIKPEVEIVPSGDFDTDVYNITLKCTRVLEEIIRQYPDQYIWNHNRWRTRRKLPT